MDFVKAKNISIIAFIILNIMLGALRYMESWRYTLTYEHQGAITTVLNDHNIVLSDNFTFPRHNPKQQISLNYTTFNKNSITNALITNNNNIRIRTENDKTILENDYEKITFLRGHVKYENIANNDIIIINETDAIEFSKETIKNLGELGKNYILDRKTVGEDEIILEYREYFSDNIIYTNYIIFTFKNNTVKEIEIYYNSVNTFIGNSREIVLSNEALMSFLSEARLIHQFNIITILQMDIVYRQQEYGLDYNSSLIAIPFYRIYYKIDNNKSIETKVMLINAYTNIVE